ncbi:MAG: hypothetical protein J6B91_06110 [Prevotella sp.]|nr:hypothetical protein [Prevotella sp.]
MNIYSIVPHSSNWRNLIVYQNNNDRLMEYFVFNDNDGSFLQYIALTGVPQRKIKQDVLDVCDYLKGNICIPMFSERFVNLMGPILKDEVLFYPIDIINDNTHTTFFATKIIKYMELIDDEQTAKAEDKDRENGIMFSSPIVFQENIAPFLIARDINEPFRWFVSDDFKSICNKNRLRVKFIDNL